MRNILILAVAIVSFNCCNVKRYADGVKEDTERIFISNKTYIINLSMKGIVEEKNFYEDRVLCKYVIRLRLNDLGEHPDIGQIQYPPYYSFIGDSLIDISVSEYLYKHTEVKDTIIKNKKTIFVLINSSKMQLLNQDEKTWLP